MIFLLIYLTIGFLLAIASTWTVVTHWKKFGWVYLIYNFFGWVIVWPFAVLLGLELL
jgi:hypothetical protein